LGITDPRSNILTKNVILPLMLITLVKIYNSIQATAAHRYMHLRTPTDACAYKPKLATFSKISPTQLY
jgi:hypothetical protein